MILKDNFFWPADISLYTLLKIEKKIQLEIKNFEHILLLLERMGNSFLVPFG
jgi:hypothetical protein